MTGRLLLLDIDDDLSVVVVMALVLGRRELRRNGTAVPDGLDRLIDTLAARGGLERTRLVAAPAVPEPVLVSIVDAARRLAVSDRTVRRMVARGELAVTRIGRRVLVPLVELQELAVRRAS